MRLVAAAVVISILWLACAYAPASGLDDNPTALAALQATADQAQPWGQMFSLRQARQSDDGPGRPTVQFRSIRAGFGQINHPNQALNSSTPRALPYRRQVC